LRWSLKSDSRDLRLAAATDALIAQREKAYLSVISSVVRRRKLEVVWKRIAHGQAFE